MAKILIVDDEPGIRAMLQTLLTKVGHEAVTAEDGRKALELVKASTFDVIISDLRMPCMDGLSLLRAVKALEMPIPLILVTAYASDETATEAVMLGVFDYLAKPFNNNELLDTVDRALSTGINA